MTSMYGTSGAPFVSFAEFPAGRVGYRKIGTDTFRVRVEPASNVETLPFGADWKQPEPAQRRYSKVVNSGMALGLTLGVAVDTLATSSVN